MKKSLTKLFSGIVVLSMLMSLFVVTNVSAHQGIDVSCDFTDYVGTWNGTTVTENGTLPSAAGGKFTMYKPQTDYNGATSGVAKDNKYGTSYKVYQAYNAGSGYYGGSLFNFDTYPDNSYYLAVSMNVESNEVNQYISRSVRIWGANGGAASIARMDNGSILLFDKGTGLTYETDKWYDYKIWVNGNTGAYKWEVWSEGVKIGQQSGTNILLDTVTPVRRIEFFHDVPSNHRLWKYTDANGAEQIKPGQNTYYDNFVFKSIDKFEIDELESSNHAVMDFNDYTNTDTLKVYPTSLHGKWVSGYAGGAYHGLFAAESDRVVSARIDVPAITKTGDNQYTIPGYEGTLTRTQALYTGARFDLNSAYQIADAIYFKASLLFEDSNFANLEVQYNNHGHSPFNVSPGGTVKTYNGVDTGIAFAEDVWYDIESRMDVNTGYYIVKISDGTKTYEGTGFSSKVKGAKITRINFNFYNNDGKIPLASSMLIDDMQVGNVSKLDAPVSETFDFTDGLVPTSFETTGGTATAESQALVITSSDNAETVAKMTLPFANTTFSYDGEISVDGGANTSFLLVTASASYELIRFSEGTVSIGGAEAVNAAAGTYSVSAVVNQAGYTANVKVTDAEGNVVASGDVALGTAAVCVTSVDWKIAAGTGVVALDNVTYRTIYDFKLDSAKSTTGSDKEVKMFDDVVASFSNTVDKSTFTKESIKIASGNSAIEAISFPDDYTVKLDFAKEPGEHYYITFTNVADIYGNTLMDYIEFDTMEEDLVMSAVAYTRGNEALSLVTPGAVKAEFTAKAYNGNTYDVLYAMGLYKGNELVDIDFDTFTIGETKEEHPLNLTIPDDGNYYILKTFIWNAETNAPMTEPAILKPTTDLPVVIVKLDDLQAGASFSKWQEIEEWAVENNIKMSFGVMNYSIPLMTETEKAALVEMNENPMIELWNHGYEWRTIFSDATYEEAKADFTSANQVAGELGIRYTSFCPPSGAYNQNLVDVLNEETQYTTVHIPRNAASNPDLMAKFNNPDNNFTFLYKHITIEAAVYGEGNTSASTVVRRLDDLKKDWNVAKERGDEYVLLQSHPTFGWTVLEGKEALANGKPNPDAPTLTYGGAGNTYYDFLLWLKAQGAIFMTPSEYTEYASVNLN